jgi:hypothetical protein
MLEFDGVKIIAVFFHELAEVYGELKMLPLPGHGFEVMWAAEVGRCKNTAIDTAALNRFVDLNEPLGSSLEFRQLRRADKKESHESDIFSIIRHDGRGWHSRQLRSDIDSPLIILKPPPPKKAGKTVAVTR